MSFDEVRLPLKIQYGSTGGPQFSTDIVTIQGGYERRNQRWSQARRKYDARTGVISGADANILLAFFQARAGRARGFRLKDWNDFSSAKDGISAPSFDDQVIGEGDGSTVSFQLVKSYGSADVLYEREIRKPVSDSVLVGADGVEYETEWSVDETTGVVTFSEAPASGVSITAGFEFDVPVRFDTDQLNLTARNLKQSQTEIPLIEVRV